MVDREYFEDIKILHGIENIFYVVFLSSERGSYSPKSESIPRHMISRTVLKFPILSRPVHINLSAWLLSMQEKIKAFIKVFQYKQSRDAIVQTENIRRRLAWRHAAGGVNWRGTRMRRSFSLVISKHVHFMVSTSPQK